MMSDKVREGKHLSGLAASTVISASLASAIHVLLFLRGFYSATLDESGRTLDAYNWVHGSESLATVWLPFYKIVVGIALLVLPDLFVTPRIVSFVFGIFTLWTVIWFSHVLFRDRTTTLITGVIVAIFPARVVLTVAPLAEIMFIPAIVLAMGYLTRWFSSGNNRDLWSASIAIAIASSIRYEGWIFAGVFFLGVLLLVWRAPGGKSVSLTSAAGLVLVANSFLIGWMLVHFVQSGRVLGFVGETAGRYAQLHGDSLSFLLLNNPLTQFAFQNAWTLNLIGVFSLVSYGRRHPAARIAPLIPVVALLLVSQIALWGEGMPTHAFWRVPALWSVLLIPFTANWFVERFSSLRVSAALERTGVAILSVCMAALCLRGIYSMTERSAFSRDDLAAGRYLDSHLSEQSGSRRVLIESDIWSYINVVVASQHPERFIFNSGFDPVEHGNPILNPEEAFDDARLHQMDIALMVFRREDYTDYLEGRTEIQRLEEFGPWIVYAFPPVHRP